MTYLGDQVQIRRESKGWSRGELARRSGVTDTAIRWLETGASMHSRKPSVVADVIERVSPGPYVELFARQPRLGWDSWGFGYEGVA